MSDFNVDKVRMQFPLLNKILESKSKPIVYLDSAATSHKPQSVINAVSNYYESQNSNVHRSAHYLAAIATQKFENTRVKAQKFLNAKSSSEVIFTKLIIFSSPTSCSVLPNKIFFFNVSSNT